MRYAQNVALFLDRPRILSTQEGTDSAIRKPFVIHLSGNYKEKESSRRNNRRQAPRREIPR